MQYLIALKFGTQKGDIGKGASWYQVWLEYDAISNYSQKITPICCHTYRVNCLWEETENWYMDRLPIEPQTFCSLKEIELKTMKI